MRHQILREMAGELLGTSLLVALVFASGAVRAQLGAGSVAGALLGSAGLGLGYGLVLWLVGPISGAQTNPLVSIVASMIGPQRWVRTALRIVAQVAGAAAIGLVISRVAPYTFAHDTPNISPRLLAEAVASFSFLFVALGVAHRRDVKVPLALGAITTASFWMTGLGTLGNPLLSFTVLLVAGADHATGLVLLRVGAATVVGSGLGVGLALFLFPHARESAATLLFVPRTGSFSMR